MAARDVCIVLVVLSQIAELVHSGAILEVQMLTYKNPSGRDWYHDRCDSRVMFGKSDCDTMLTFCFDRSSGNANPDSCAYKRETTGEFNNENSISFDHDMMSVRNPIKLTIISWPGAIRFKVKIMDDDSFNSDDLVDKMNTAWTLTPSRSVNQAGWSRRYITGTRRSDKTSLTLNLRLYCENNYYNSRCSQYCKAADGPRHYTCDSDTGDKVCRPGWEGNICDIRSDDCIDNKCTNGATCVDGYRRYTCECPDGYTGRHCEIDIDECASAPCLNGGRCIDQVAGYRCVCQIVYVGATCSHHVCDSDQSPCLNGGTCYVSHGQARCMCPAAFSGDVCERDKCLDMSCLNRGACEGGRCVCRPGFFGYYCSVDVCLLRPCMNAGTCEGGVCSCAPGYRGLYCHLQTNECESDPCQHDGTCRDLVNGFTCDCLPDYNGTLCEHVILPPALPTWVYATAGPDTWTNETNMNTAVPANSPTRRDGTTSATLGGSGNKAKQRDGQTVQKQSDGVPPWMIVVIVALGVLVLLIVFMFVAMVRRYKKKVSRAEMGDAVVLHVDQNGGGNHTITGISNPDYDSVTVTVGNGTCRCVPGSPPPCDSPPPYVATPERQVTAPEGAVAATATDGADVGPVTKVSLSESQPRDSHIYETPPPPRHVPRDVPTASVNEGPSSKA